MDQAQAFKQAIADMYLELANDAVDEESLEGLRLINTKIGVLSDLQDRVEDLMGSKDAEDGKSND